MSNVVVVGSQWGDEGKGKIVDYLARDADIVVRFQGGHNAGHTVVIGTEEYRLRVLPSGILHADKICIIGNGVVIDPWELCDEIDALRARGMSLSPERVIIADNAPLVLPIHSVIDHALENARGESAIGTTRRGIGPAYEDKVARRAIRVCDLSDPTVLETKVTSLLVHYNALLRGLHCDTVSSDDLIERLREVVPRLWEHVSVGVVWRRLEEAQRAGKRILFEGAQGVMLDVDHGTYPFVTSSNTVAGQAWVGSGMGEQPNGVRHIIGTTKAYSTRVGSGPFPTELHDDIGKQIATRGQEVGTVTGRVRRVGWFDAVAVRQAITLSGISGLALTKIDVLDELDEIKICIRYWGRGEYFDYLPATQSIQSEVVPIYQTLRGWKQNTRGLVSWTDLPSQASDYIKCIEDLVGAPVLLLSTGPEHKDTITRVELFAAGATLT